MRPLPVCGPPGVSDRLRPWAAAQRGGQSPGRGQLPCRWSALLQAPGPTAVAWRPIPLPAQPVWFQTCHPATHPQGSAARPRPGPPRNRCTLGSRSRPISPQLLWGPCRPSSGGFWVCCPHRAAPLGPGAPCLAGSPTVKTQAHRLALGPRRGSVRPQRHRGDRKKDIHLSPSWDRAVEPRTPAPHPHSPCTRTPRLQFTRSSGRSQASEQGCGAA